MKKNEIKHSSVNNDEKWHHKHKMKWLISLVSCGLITTGIGIGIGYAIWHNNTIPAKKVINYYFANGEPRELVNKSQDQSSTTIVLTLNGQDSNQIELRKNDDIDPNTGQLINPLTNSQIMLEQLTQTGTWKISFNDDADFDHLFTIALRIVDKNDSSHKIDVEIEAYPANTPPEAIYNSIPEEYLISERQYYENNGQDQGSEDKLYAINFASLVIDPKFLEYDTLLIPDTFNSVIHNLGIGNYSEYARNVEHLVFVSNANTPFSFDAEGSFQDCTNFIDVIATGRDISHIRVNTFSGCTNLIKIVTSGFSNLSIGEFAFNGCYKFEGFDAPVDSIDITSIGSYAFNGCASLTFAGLNSIASVNGTEKIITPENAGIAFKPIDKLIPFFQKGCLISGHIDLSRPEWQTFLPMPENAFGLCYSLQSVVFGPTISSISQGAFIRCISLSEITIPDGQLTTIANQAFDSCFLLQKINLGFTTLPIGFTISSGSFNECGRDVPQDEDCIISGNAANAFRTLAWANGDLPERWEISS